MNEIQSRVPYDVYRALEGVNFSRLKKMSRSPLHFLKSEESQKETAPLRLGSASHCAVLEPERFERDYAVWRERTESGRLRPRNGKDYDTFCRHNEGRSIITVDEEDDVKAIQAAVRGDETAMAYLDRGDPEVTMRWRKGEHQCKGRVDWLTKRYGMDVLVGLKTSRDCRDFMFGIQAAKLGYAMQWAMYYDGYKAITGREAKVVEIVVESAAPYAVATYVITTDIIEQGRAEYEGLLEALSKCEAEDAWPGPVQGERRLTLPRWAFASDDEDDVVNSLGLEA